MRNICEESTTKVCETKLKLNSVALDRERTILKSGRRRSAKLVPTFADRGVSCGQRNGSPQPLISVFLDRSRYFLFK